MTIYFEKDGDAIAVNINTETELIIGDDFNPYGCTLYYRNPSDWYFVVPSGHTVSPSLANCKRWTIAEQDAIQKSHRPLLPIDNQEDGEFYDTILRVNTP